MCNGFSEFSGLLVALTESLASIEPPKTYTKENRLSQDPGDVSLCTVSHTRDVLRFADLLQDVTSVILHSSGHNVVELRGILFTFGWMEKTAKCKIDGWVPLHGVPFYILT